MLPIASLLTVALPEDQVSASTAAEEEDSPRPADPMVSVGRSARVLLVVASGHERAAAAGCRSRFVAGGDCPGGKSWVAFDASIKTRSAGAGLDSAVRELGLA